MTYPEVPLKRILHEVDDPSVDGREDLFMLSKDRGLVPRTSMDGMSEAANYAGYKRFQARDLVMNKMQAWNGVFGFSDQAGIVSPDYAVFRLNRADTADVRFLNYLVRTPYMVGRFAGASRGMGTGFNRLHPGPFLSISAPLPTVDEQRRIVDFLDDQVQRLDAVIRSRQEQIDALAEVLRSKAYDAVTGHALQVDKRRSGLPWAPELPATWGEPRICQVAKMGTGHTPSRSIPEYWLKCDVPWLTTGDVHRFRHDEIERISETALQISELGMANSAAVLHPAGTVALSRTASAGFSIIMDVAMATSQDYATWTPGPALSSDYLLWCLRVMRPDIMGRLAIGSTHKTIYFPDLMSIRIPLPPLPEQLAAVADVHETAEWVASGRATLEASIDKLREFKAALISAAVTGEFDIQSASGRFVA